MEERKRDRWWAVGTGWAGCSLYYDIEIVDKFTFRGLKIIIFPFFYNFLGYLEKFSFLFTFFK